MSLFYPRKTSGVVLIITIQILFALSIIALAALKTTVTNIMICGNLKDIKRAYYLAEAGTKHAAEFLKQDLSNWDNYATFGTLLGTTGFVKGTYSVTIEGAGARRRKIISTGTTHTGAVARIEVIFVPLCYVTSTFNFGVFGHNAVSLTGDSYIDSYDSSVGPWSEGTRNSNGDVGTNATGAGSLVLNSAIIYGDAYVGYGGDPGTDITKVGGGTVTGDESVLFRPKDMETISDPGGGIPATLELPTGTKTFYSGVYRLPKIQINNGLAIIDGQVTFCVNNSITILATGEIRLLAGSSLTIYVSGEVKISGNSIVNLDNKPSSFLLYGTPGCTKATFSGTEEFYGAVYLPNADISLNGGGPIFGAVVGKTVTMVGTTEIHYDEALRKINEKCVIYDLRPISSRVI